MTSLEDLIDDDEFEPLESNLLNVIEDKELQWVFVGGKGGVGKTTVSSSIAVQLAAKRESVLIISTDPAHNLSDAFSQKFSKSPTLVEGFKNLFAMEIDPNFDTDEMFGDFVSQNSSMKGLIKDLAGSMPGMDELTSFMEIMKLVKQMKFSCVVFDTAPTGHTLRLLSLPSLFDNGIGKVFQSGLVGQLSSMFTNMDTDKMQEQTTGLKSLVEDVSRQFKDPNLCTFVCVCIPEFLSVYETERLVQELTKNGIDSHNVVVNQIVFQSKTSTCESCKSRVKIQQKYLNQIFDLYQDFHIVQLPLLGSEVRGVEALKQFGENLTSSYPEKFQKEEDLKK